MMINDTLTRTTTGNNQQTTPPPSNPALPDDSPQACLHFIKRIRGLETRKLDSHEFLRYPKLTTKLRTLLDFPVLKQIYPLEPPDQETRPGYYDDCIRYYFYIFNEELSAVSQQVKLWLSTDGQKPETPIIQSITVNKEGWVERCVISGLEWDIPVDPFHARQRITCLDLHSLFSIDRQRYIRVEDAIPGSPLIALYIQDDLNEKKGHNDQLFWYNLDTRRRGQMTDAVRYQK